MTQVRVALVDTSIIIEAIRSGCWNATCKYCSVETVEKCCEEALSGDPLRRDYVAVDPEELLGGLSNRHAVPDVERVELSLKLTNVELDPGERDLLAHALGRSDEWVVCLSDRAAVNAALKLGWETRIVTLEHLAKGAGASPTLRYNYTEKWLSGVRTDFKLAQI